MNIIYSSDDNYARHVGISMMSLFEQNKAVKEINIFLIDNEISKENRGKLNDIVQYYNRKIFYVPFAKFKQKLRLNNEREMPISAYARIFVSEMIPQTVERLLYLDCDTLICDSLEELWNTDLQGNTIGAVEDVMSCILQKEIKTGEMFRYFCSGVILIDLKKWRSIDAQKLLIEFLDQRKGVVGCHDQTMLNGVFFNDCLMLHPRYDALTPTFIMSYQNLKAYFGIWDRYYSKQEIKESVRNPAIIHFTSANIGRPWENRKHPKAKIYRRYWRKSPWRDIPFGRFVPTCSKKEEKVLWLYRHVPVSFINRISELKKTN